MLHKAKPITSLVYQNLIIEKVNMKTTKIALMTGDKQVTFTRTPNSFLAFHNDADPVNILPEDSQLRKMVSIKSVFPSFGVIVKPKQENDAEEVLRLATKDERFAVAHPVLSSSNDREVLLTDRLLLGVTDADNIESLIESENLKLLEMISERELHVSVKGGELLEIIENLKRRREIEYIEPDLLVLSKNPPFLVEDGSSTSDPLFLEQWALRKVNALDAWKIAPPDPNVTIAVIDVGVDGDHPDLKVTAGFNSITDVNSQTPAPWEYHGTLCAGVATAVPGNEIGLRGIAGGCKLFAIKAADQAEAADQWLWSFASVVRAFDWAWKSGADVISCSWEASWGGEIPSTAVNKAIERARTFGRKGKGCVVVFSAGNIFDPTQQGPVKYPANLPGVLTVSAVNAEDEFKTLTSSDGDSRWGSCSGPEVDLAAPGVKIYTTDIHGEGGVVPKLAPGDNDYFKFNGTSAAAPIVAGSAALVISANPDLTEREVRGILCETADKISTGEAYVGGRNDQVGSGRVNVLAAVEETKRRKNKR